MSAHTKPGSLLLVLIIILGLSAVFAVAAFAINAVSGGRPLAAVVCVFDKNNPNCQNARRKSAGPNDTTLTPPQVEPATGINHYYDPVKGPLVTP